MAVLSLLPCSTYEESELYTVLNRSLSGIGFNVRELKGKRVGIKPNLLSPHAPDRGVITNVNFFNTVISIVLENGGVPVLIESPGFVSLQEVLEKTEYGKVVRKHSLHMADTKKIGVLENPRGIAFRSFEVINEFFELDYLINLPKFKTHGLTYITAGVKNLFGLVPGKRKARWHFRARRREHFVNMLLDLYQAVINRMGEGRVVHLLDAIQSMEGEGPGSSGDPRHTGIVMAGFDAIALDTVATGLMGLQPKKVLTSTIGARRELGKISSKEITITGANVDSFNIKPFRSAQASTVLSILRWFQFFFRFKEFFSNKPVPVKGICTLCYSCMKICPAHAISVARRGSTVPMFDYRKCFRCYCCMEACPDAAIRVKRSFM